MLIPDTIPWKVNGFLYHHIGQSDLGVVKWKMPPKKVSQNLNLKILCVQEPQDLMGR
jgi:hypothetical protein